MLQLRKVPGRCCDCHVLSVGTNGINWVHELRNPLNISFFTSTFITITKSATLVPSPRTLGAHRIIWRLILLSAFSSITAALQRHSITYFTFTVRKKGELTVHSLETEDESFLATINSATTTKREAKGRRLINAEERKTTRIKSALKY